MLYEELLSATAGEVVYKLVRASGLEFSSPRSLSKRAEFPNCTEVLTRLVSGKKLDSVSAKKYIRLCQLAALAWLTWVGVVVCLWSVLGMLAWHQFVAHEPIATHPFFPPLYPPVTCGVVLFVIGVMWFLIAQAYSLLRFYAQQMESHFPPAKKQTLPMNMPRAANG
jgi:hypothetical protein